MAKKARKRLGIKCDNILFSEVFFGYFLPSRRYCKGINHRQNLKKTGIK